jgi:hypothetical protein
MHRGGIAVGILAKQRTFLCAFCQSGSSSGSRTELQVVDRERLLKVWIAQVQWCGSPGVDLERFKESARVKHFETPGMGIY